MWSCCQSGSSNIAALPSCLVCCSPALSCSAICSSRCLACIEEEDAVKTCCMTQHCVCLLHDTVLHLSMVQCFASSAEQHIRMCRLWTMKCPRPESMHTTLRNVVCIVFQADLLLEEGPALSQDEQATIQDESCCQLQMLTVMCRCYMSCKLS